jgi:hypothetical protein
MKIPCRLALSNANNKLNEPYACEIKRDVQKKWNRVNTKIML